MNKGSIWRKWDLHIHSPASFHQDYGDSNQEKTWEDYTKKLESLTDIQAIAITDYFTIEGYKRIKDYKENKNRLKNLKLILPNIELRCNHIITSRGMDEKLTEIHVIFNDKLDIEEIQENFIDRIRIKHQDQKIALNDRNIRAVGDHYKDITNESGDSLVIGYKKISVDFDEILQILKEHNKFSGNYLIILPDRDWSSVDWSSRAGATRVSYYFNSHATFSSNENSRNFLLGQDPRASEDVIISAFGGLKPCIHGSDAHSLDKIGKPDENRFCWLKVDQTFEGLKQILYEPKERVYINENCPEPQKSVYTLKKLKISNGFIKDNLRLLDTEIYLNSSLVTIIGGKGSGKTAILDLVANCFIDRCKRNNSDENSFVRRIEEENPDLSVNLEFIGDSVDEFTKNIIDKNFFEYSKVTYLPQDEIEEISGDTERLHDKITEIIFNSEKIKDKGLDKEIKELNDNIETSLLKIKELNGIIFVKESESSAEKMHQIHSEIKLNLGSRIDIQARLDKLTSIKDSNFQEKLSELKIKENYLSKKLSRLNTLNSNLNKVFVKIHNLLTINNEIKEVNEEIVSLFSIEPIPDIKFPAQISRIEQIRIKVTSDIKLSEDELVNVTKQISLKTEDTQKVELLYKELHRSNKKIHELNEEEKRISQIKKDLDSLTEKRFKKLLSIIESTRKLKQKYDEAIKLFSEGDNGSLNKISFTSEYKFDKEMFLESTHILFDGRSTKDEDFEKTIEIYYRALNCEELNYGIIESYRKSAEAFKQFLRRKKGENISISFYNWIFENYVSIIFNVFFEGTSMKKLSIGQKGTVLLKLFLAEGNYPLIIDQPEENLDNEYIYKDLVKSIREAKQKRQILIATHNANLVINTDAEQIIIAKYFDNEINYTVGSIEDLDIRNDVTTILEGGEIAFKKREEKYDL